MNTSNNTKIKVMVVEDSILQRALIRSILERDAKGRFQVVASAHNGIDALEKLKRHSHEIDVITLDIEMPKMNGLEALKEIMETNPKPVIMFSSLTTSGAAKETIQALSLGAVDFIAKPTSGDIKELDKELYEKVFYASKIKKNFYSKFKMEEPQLIIERKREQDKEKQKVKKTELTNLILIGSSTGGPRALTKIMSEIPDGLNACIVIVQHMQTGGFTASFANSLNQISRYDVKEAENGDELCDGKVFVAPAGLHSEIFNRSGSLKIILNEKGLEYRHKPSVDVLFSSVARLNLNIRTFGVVLTGMGDDGSNGCEALKRIKSTVIAESEKTAILYGMPKQVAKRGLADYIEDLENVFPRILKIIKST